MLTKNKVNITDTTGLVSNVVYRIGDSVTNVFSPMISFFALIIVFVKKYDLKAGIGTIIAK